MPAWRDSMGLRSDAGRPSIRISPPSRLTMPPSTFMRVDLPAPLAPMSAITSPVATESSAWSRATTPGNALVMLRMTMYGMSMSASCRREPVESDEGYDDAASDHLVHVETYFG